jgi:hypothetical protein
MFAGAPSSKCIPSDNSDTVNKLSVTALQHIGKIVIPVLVDGLRAVHDATAMS